MTWEGLAPPYATIVADPPWPYEGSMPINRGSRAGQKMRFLSYSAMSLDEIKALPVGQLGAPGAHLFLWTTNRYVWDAREVALAWGWRPTHLLTWCKEPVGHGLGAPFASTSGFVLFCRRPIGEAIRAARAAAGLSAKAVCAAIGAHGNVNHGGAVSNWEQDLSFPTQKDWAGLRRLLPDLAELPDLAAEPNRVGSTWWQWKRGPHSAKPPAFLDLVEQVSPEPRVELFARAQRLGWDSWGWGYEQAAGA